VHDFEARLAPEHQEIYETFWRDGHLCIVRELVETSLRASHLLRSVSEIRNRCVHIINYIPGPGESVIGEVVSLDYQVWGSISSGHRLLSLTEDFRWHSI
jgi:hypothetical protein